VDEGIFQENIHPWETYQF